jgi:hypothetical protein
MQKQSLKIKKYPGGKKGVVKTAKVAANLPKGENAKYCQFPKYAPGKHKPLSKKLPPFGRC